MFKKICFSLALILLAACQQSATVPSLSISPVSFTVPAGGPAKSFSATVKNSTAKVSWTLTGAGSISASTGSSISYTPPALSSSDATAKLKASLEGTSASADIIIVANAGSLSVTVTGLAASSAADITLTGPNGFSKTLTASQNLTDLLVGTYGVTAKAVRAESNGLEAILKPEVTGSPLTISAGKSSSVMVNYSLQAGTPALLVPSYGSGRVGIFSAAQLASSSATVPAIAVEGAPSAQGLAFDSEGNLWVTDWDANMLRKYTQEQLLSSGTPTPDAIISSNNESLKNPTALAFDASGNLWVSNRGNATVVRFNSGQLATSGSPKPNMILSDDGSGNLSGPSGIAFDQQGGLWFTNTFSQSIYNYATPANLIGAVTTSPDVIISTTINGDTSLDAPLGLAFDQLGNLWVSNYGINTLVKFSPSQLEFSGTPVPEVTLSGLNGPAGIAFDAGGNLWVAGSSSTVLKLAAADLSTSSSPTPAVMLTGLTDIDLGFLAFNPPPSHLFIRSLNGSARLNEVRENSGHMAQNLAASSTKNALQKDGQCSFMQFVFVKQCH